MKVRQFQDVKNQFIITDDNGNRFFQSYDSIIIKIDKDNKITLGKHWNYSVTTAKYRNLFLNETTKEVQAKIDSGVYVIDPEL